MKKLVVAITGTTILAVAGIVGVVLVAKEIAKEMGH